MVDSKSNIKFEKTCRLAEGLKLKNCDVMETFAPDVELAFLNYSKNNSCILHKHNVT
jgi:hypothetical protein